jgi:hypothetical protein
MVIRLSTPTQDLVFTRSGLRIRSGGRFQGTCMPKRQQVLIRPHTGLKGSGPSVLARFSLLSVGKA